MTDIRHDTRSRPLLRNLQYSPIRQEDEQYVVLWDPSGLTTDKLILPMNYFYLLQFFDGEHSIEQIAGEYLKKFGEFLVPDRVERLVADMDEKLFLEGDRVEEAKQLALDAYRRMPVRPAVFAGKSYEENPQKLTDQLKGFFESKEGPITVPSTNKGKAVKGLVAPHYELKESGPIAAWAYRELDEGESPDLFVILGTCHAGLGQGFAVTDKDFETPLGTVSVDREVLDRFRRHGGDRFFEDEICHRQEHTIEFQLPFLQHTVGRKKRMTIVPVLCAFSPFFLTDPEHVEMASRIESFLDAMKQALAGLGRPVCIIASADLAHIGLRFGDSQPPTDFSFHRCLQSDLEMLKYVEQLDPEGFTQFISKEGDKRRIFGFAPIYSLLKLIQAQEGQMLRYDRGITDQYNSTVTYASMAFF